jgi:hypothetical protein
MDPLSIEGDLIHAVSPEGQKATMTVDELLKQANRRRMSSRGVVLPDGVKYLDSKGHTTIWVHETPPRVYGFKWIAEDSPARFGPGAKYREVRIALPYLIVLAAFEGEMLSPQNECFFRTAPLEDEGDELFYPALLNCSKFTPPEGRPLSWICTAKVGPEAYPRCRNRNQRLRAGFRALMRCLLETGFNYSSEDHEGSSWFTESTRCDPRVSSVQRWEEETSKDKLFVNDVQWLKTGLSLRQVIDRMYEYRGLRGNGELAVSDLMRMIFNQPRSKPKKPNKPK